MNFGSNAAFELADIRAEQEREAKIAAASRAVRATGSAECEDCESEISKARRLAMPSATRCILCQTRHEQETR
jgi:phage/conjugal plasmid C-4 type zinc finger TraR family protein